MFTFKKIALIGAAGLAALSISCSDDGDDSSPGGEFDSFTVTTGADGYALLGGQIKASEGIQVTGVAATADGKTVSLTPPPTLGVTVSLANVNVVGICAATSVTTSKSFKIVVTATFSAGDKVSKEGNVTIDCSTPGEDFLLDKKSFTLSDDDSSYRDLDANVSYVQGNLTATIKAKIDLVAYNGQVGEDEDGNPLPETMIYAPAELDIFYDAAWNYLGGYVGFFAIPATKVAALNAATKLSDLEAIFTEAEFEALISEDKLLTYIPIANNTAFFVITTEEALQAVIITSSGVKTVNLSSFFIDAEN